MRKPLQLLEPIEDDVDSLAAPARANVLDHQESLSVGVDVVVRHELVCHELVVLEEHHTPSRESALGVGGD